MRGWFIRPAAGPAAYRSGVPTAQFGRTFAGLFVLDRRRIGMSEAAFWLGFIAIFVNNIHLKVIWYNPVVTDGVAASLSLAMLLCFLKGKEWWLILVTLLGAFTWPTLIYAGGFLLAFPRRPVETRGDCAAALAGGRLCGAGGSVVNGVSSAGVPQRIARAYAACSWGHRPGPDPLRALCLCRNRWPSAGNLRLRHLEGVLAPPRDRRCGLAIAVSIPAWLWANHALYAVGLDRTLYQTLLRAMLHPLGFLIAHPESFGPAILLLYLYWKPFAPDCAEVRHRPDAGDVDGDLDGNDTGIAAESAQLPDGGAVFGIAGRRACPACPLCRAGGGDGGCDVEGVGTSGAPSASRPATVTLVPRNLLVNEQGTWMTDRIYLIKLVVALVATGILLLAQHIFKRTGNESGVSTGG